MKTISKTDTSNMSDSLDEKLKKLSLKIDDIQKQNFSNLENSGQSISVDATPVQNSTNAVSSGGVFSALATKQNTLTAGNNITISNGVISATDTTYTAGSNITISNGVISSTCGLSSVTASDVDSESAMSGQVLTADGNGNATWTTISTGLSSVQDGNIDSESATSGQVLTADGQGGASWQTASGGDGMTQEQSTKLDQAYNYFLTHVVEPDPSYNPQTYSEYPVGTIFQTYAKFSQRCNYTFTRTLTSPNMVFSAIDNSSGILSIKLIFTYSSNFNGTIDIYQNNTSIYHEAYSFNNPSLSCVFERTINGVTLADGNVFYVKIVSNTSTSFILTKYESDLVAPNAEVINQISPFCVDYFEGKYYVSDCSSGTAKIAEINVEDIYNINSLTWVDTGIDCLQYKTSFKMVQYGNEWIGDERVDYYRNLDNSYTFIKHSDSSTATYSNLYLLDWGQTTETQIRYGMDKKNNGMYLLAYNLSSFSTGTRASGNFYNFCCSKHLVDITSSSTRVYAVTSKANGHLYPYLMHTSSSYTNDMGFGKNQHCYYNNPNTSVVPMICFCNYYGKILKKEFQYNASDREYVLTNTTEIGAYDEYFEGVNNDYFVVKNGALEYHKKSI